MTPLKDREELWPGWEFKIALHITLSLLILLKYKCYTANVCKNATGHKSLFYQYRMYPKHSKKLIIGLRTFVLA